MKYEKIGKRIHKVVPETRQEMSSEEVDTTLKRLHRDLEMRDNDINSFLQEKKDIQVEIEELTELL